jgi:hypothetical protein
VSIFTGGFTVFRPQHNVFAGTELQYGDVFGNGARTTIPCFCVYRIDPVLN